jgi:uncharacterized integral membrane protein
MAWLSRALLVVLVIVVFLFGLFAVKQTPTSLQFLDWQTRELSVFWWLLIAFVLGLLLGVTGSALITMKRAIQNRHMRRELDQSRQELVRLRNITLHD